MHDGGHIPGKQLEDITIHGKRYNISNNIFKPLSGSTPHDE